MKEYSGSADHAKDVRDWQVRSTKTERKRTTAETVVLLSHKESETKGKNQLPESKVGYIILQMLHEMVCSKEETGTHFDVDVANAFLDSRDKIESYLSEYTEQN